MNDIEDIKLAIETCWPTLPAAGLCVRLLEYVAHLPEVETRLMTMPLLARGVGLRGVDQELVTALTILVSSSFELLQPRAMFIADDSEEFELDTDDLHEARLEGQLVHPETGESIPDFEDKLYPFFVPTARLKAIMQSGHGG